MLVVHELHLPEMLVVEIRCAAMLETRSETACIEEQFQIPLLQGNIMKILPHLLGVGAKTGHGKGKGQNQPSKMSGSRTFYHTARYSAGVSGA